MRNWKSFLAICFGLIVTIPAMGQYTDVIYIDVSDENLNRSSLLEKVDSILGVREGEKLLFLSNNNEPYFIKGSSISRDDLNVLLELNTLNPIPYQDVDTLLYTMHQEQGFKQDCHFTFFIGSKYAFSREKYVSSVAERMILILGRGYEQKLNKAQHTVFLNKPKGSNETFNYKSNLCSLRWY